MRTTSFNHKAKKIVGLLIAFSLVVVLLSAGRDAPWALRFENEYGAVQKKRTLDDGRGLILEESYAVSQEDVFAHRWKRISEFCDDSRNVSGKNYSCKTQVPSYGIGENKKFVYCAVAKASSSFWRAALPLIENEKPPDYLYRWKGRMLKLETFRSQHTDLESVQFFESATWFTFVREPYGRIFSAYNDKIFRPNLDFWKYTASYVIKLVRRNRTEDSLKIGHDVTFLELIQYIILRWKSGTFIDRHFAPMHSRCDPCRRKQIYVGKLETFVDDATFLISKLSNNTDYDHLLEMDDSLSAAHTAHLRVHALFTLLNETQGLQYPRYKIFLRTWRDFQIRGILSKDTEMPLKESDASSITEKEFEKILITALEQPVNKTLVKKQRKEALLQAYSTIPREVLEELRRYVEADCALFGYENTPKWLFQPDSSVKNVAFNYFDAL